MRSLNEEKNHIMLWSYMLLPIIISIIGMLIIHISIRRKIKRDMKYLLEVLRGPDWDSPIDISLIKTAECRQIASEMLTGHHRILSLQSEKLYAEAKRTIANQVAHDIRSPIAAINTVLLTLQNTSEKQKNLIKSASSRINDIANELSKN